MKLKIPLLCLVMLLGSSLLQQVWAQTLTVSGKVKNKTTGEPIPLVTVNIEGTSKSVTTDPNGGFNVNANNGQVLVFSYVGMTTVKYTVVKQESIEIMLEDNSKALSEVVVVGYGTQRITKVSGAIATIKSADVEKLKPVRVEEMLQGAASGVTVVQNGSPGTKPTVLIRGIPSYTGNGPLIIVDGVQQSQDDLNSISASDIESINVLKDAAANSIYGVNGGNGVVVITTKSGRKNQKTEYSVNSSYGFQEVMNTIKVLNATEYGAMINEGSVASGGGIIFPNLSALGVGTNWQDQIFKTAPISSHTLSARGGSDKVSYFLSGSYFSQGGIVGGYDKSRFNRLNVTSNLTFDLTSKLKFIVNTTYLNFNSKGVQENSFNSIIGSALNYDPTVSLKNNVAGTVGQNGFSTLLLSEIFNPLTKLDNTYNQNIGNKLYGKFELQYDVLKNLKLTTRFGYTKYDGNAKSFTPLVFWGINNVDNSMNADGSAVSGKHNSVNHEKSTYNNFNYELFGNYNFKVKEKHSFETVAGLTISKATGNVASASRQDVPFNSWDFADFTAATGNNSATNTNALTGSYYQYFKRNLSYFGRANYDYEERYLASLIARVDGSTAFGKDNKFAKFYSGSLGWVVSKEKFFNVDAISLLKIRGSYGSSGNDNTTPQYSRIQTDWGASLYGSGANSIGYTFGTQFYSGSTLGSLSNDQLRWEKQIQSNIGFDMNLFKNKLTIIADYFEKKVDGLLFVPSASLYLGTIPTPMANIGSTKTSGFDMSIGVNHKFSKAFTLNTALNFTTFKSIVTKTNDDGSAWIYGGGYFNGQSQNVTVFAPNYTPGFFYGYKTDGLFQTAEQISKSATQSGAQPGDIKYVDINGDGVIDGKDKTQIGNPFPDFTLGWTLNLTYKQFDLSVYTYASIGNDVYRAWERNANYTNKYQDVLGRWTGPNTTNDARYPRYSFTDANNNSRVSDRYVEDGSFVKIKNLQLGYNIPAAKIKKLFKGLRVYCQVKNALMLTKYSGFDPEISGGILDTGIDRGSYPQARTYTFGLDIKL